MPNWVTSRLTVEGPKSVEVLQSLMKKEPTELSDFSFDFNKIKPMPESLNVEASSISTDCVKLYLDSLKKDDELYTKYFTAYLQAGNSGYTKLNKKDKKDILTNCLNHTNWESGKKVFETEDDVYAYGKKILDNVINYGYPNWYEWSYANWGTKWNACHTVYDNSNVVIFDTAWADVRQLIFELSKMFPENKFIYEYAEEQVGYYVGRSEFQNGEILKDFEYPNYSKEAFDLSFDLLGEDLKDYYRFDDKTNTYEYIDDDEDLGNNEGEMS